MPYADTIKKLQADRKMYYSMSEVCDLTALKDSVLRHWESEFRQLRPKKVSGRNRAYRVKDIETVFRIRQLLYDEKLSIPDAKKIIADERRTLKTGGGADTDGNEGNDVSIDDNSGSDDNGDDVNIDDENGGNSENDDVNANKKSMIPAKPPQLDLFGNQPSISPDFIAEIRSGLEEVLRLLG